MTRYLVPLATVLAIAAIGCQSRQIDESALVGPVAGVSFSADVQPIFNRSCGGSGCHLGSSASGVGLSSYSDVTTAVGDQYGREIVLPGNAAQSPLVDKVAGQPAFGSRMPLGRAPLSAQDISLIRTWIDEGALDN